MLFRTQLQREREETKESILSEAKMLQGQVDSVATDMLDVLKKERSDRERGFEREGEGEGEGEVDLPTARSALLREFKRITLATLVAAGPSPRRTVGSLVQVSAIDDHYVAAEEGQQPFDSQNPCIALESPPKNSAAMPAQSPAQ